MRGPAGRVLQRHAFHADVLREEHRHHRPRTEPGAVGGMQLEAVLVPREAAVLIAFAEEGRAAAVDHALAGDRHVLHLVPDDEMPAAPFLAHAPEVLRESVAAVVVGLVRAALDHGALREMQIHAVLEPDGAGKVRAGVEHHAPAARRVRGVDSPLDRRRVLRRAVALRAEGAHVEVCSLRDHRGKERCEQHSHLYGLFLHFGWEEFIKPLPHRQQPSREPRAPPRRAGRRASCRAARGASPRSRQEATPTRPESPVRRRSR